MNTNLETTIKSSVYDDQIVIIISRMGFIERMPLTKIHSLTHGGVGLKSICTRENDYVEHISLATIQSTILFFTSLGRCYWLKACDIPEIASNQNEKTVQDLLKIAVGECIRAFIIVGDCTREDFLYSHYIEFCTKNGVVKRSCLMDFFRQRNGIIQPCNNGIIAINICEGDTIVNAIVTNGENDLMLASREGRAIRFNESQVRTMGRASTGILGMRLPDGKDEVVGIIHINDVKTETVMFVCENGYGIRSNLEDFRLSHRGTYGMRSLNVTDKRGKVVDITTVTDNSDLIIFNKSGFISRIKVKSVPIKQRVTGCMKLIETFPKNDQIICVLKVDVFV